MSSIKVAYGSTSSLTITLASLGSDSSSLAGTQSTAVDNTSNLYLDYMLAGKLTTGTSPTAAKAIEVWVYGAESDGGGTAVYPDVITGTSGNVTFTTRDILSASCRLAAFLPTDSTTGRTYWFAPLSVASLFGGSVPLKWGVFVVHSTGVALNATAGNHAIYATPVYSTVA